MSQTFNWGNSIKHCLILNLLFSEQNRILQLSIILINININKTEYFGIRKSHDSYGLDNKSVSCCVGAKLMNCGDWMKIKCLATGFHRRKEPVVPSHQRAAAPRSPRWCDAVFGTGEEADLGPGRHFLLITQTSIHAAGLVARSLLHTPGRTAEHVCATGLRGPHRARLRHEIWLLFHSFRGHRSVCLLNHWSA